MDRELFQKGFQERFERRNRETRYAPISTGRVYGPYSACYRLLPCGRARHLIANKQTSLCRLYSILSNRPFLELTVQGRAIRLRSRVNDCPKYTSRDINTVLHMYLFLYRIYALYIRAAFDPLIIRAAVNPL